MSTNLSEHFTVEELIYSDTGVAKGIDNTPTEEALANLKWLCSKILEPLRHKLGKPIHINSGYRGEELNKEIGGVKPSQHCLGEASDISVSGMSAQELFDFIINETDLPFDQIILEFPDSEISWVHISYTRGKLRGNKLISEKIDGKTEYREI